MFVSMGLAAPWLGRAFHRFGARRIMVIGAGLVGCGLALVGTSVSATDFLFAWVLIGLAGAMFLTTAAYIYLSDFAEERARGLISSLMLITGLAGTIFWPVTDLLENAIGWRGAALAYAATLLGMVCPLLLVGLPETGGSPGTARAKEAGVRKGTTFWLLVIAVALNSFVTFGVETISIELFRAMGIDMARAVGIASLLGLFKVAGRVIDLLGGRRWDGLATALVSGAMIPVGLLVVCIWGASLWPVAGYLVFFGIGSGAFAVARATMPLVFYSKGDYVAAMSTIALPMNMTNALAPFALAALLTEVGPQAALGLLAALSGAAFVALLRLNGQRRPWSVAERA